MLKRWLGTFINTLQTEKKTKNKKKKRHIKKKIDMLIGMVVKKESFLLRNNRYNFL